MRATLSGRAERVYMKLVVDAESQRVLGAHIFGPEAGEMAQLVAIPMRMGATKEDFDATMAVHPTAAEELVTMRSPATAPSTRGLSGARKPCKRTWDTSPHTAPACEGGPYPREFDMLAQGPMVANGALESDRCHQRSL